MEPQLRLVVHWKNHVYDDLLVTSSDVEPFERQQPDGAAQDERKRIVKLAPRHLNDRKINSYAVSAFVYCLRTSRSYRQNAARPLLRFSESRVAQGCEPVIFIKLREPEKQFLDYAWGKRVAYMALEKCEVNYAMSWLSTLGGAFSALGDEFHDCAQIAGKISVRQFTLALQLEDPLLVGRCKLYAALSTIQQGNLRTARIMIQDIHKFAVDQRDAHLQRMCHGVWAKLKYRHKLRKQQKKLSSSGNASERGRKNYTLYICK